MISMVEEVSGISNNTVVCCVDKRMFGSMEKIYKH